jgi:hypothetical protein
MVTGNTIHPGTRQSLATKYIATTYNNTNLYAHIDNLAELTCHPCKNVGVDAVILLTKQCFAAELEQNPLIRQFAGSHYLVLASAHWQSLTTAVTTSKSNGYLFRPVYFRYSTTPVDSSGQREA